MKHTNILLLFAVVLISTAMHWPKKLEQKVKATIMKTYKLDTYELNSIQVSEEIENATMKEVNDHLFSIIKDEILQGYIYVGEAPSMKNVFDYAVLFTPELDIVNTKVLIYREKHGRQIGMKRWLKQFFGMNPTDRPTLGEEVDGISGATISATSMTEAVREILKMISYLQVHQQL